MANKPVNIVLKADYNDKDLKRVIGDLQKLQTQSLTTGAKFQETGAKMQAFGAKVAGVGKSMTMGLTLPIVGVGAAAVASAVTFESAFAGVRKTVDATEEEFATLERGIRDMSLRLPASAEAIAAVGEAAGQLGIETPNILGFSETMINLGEATNLSAEEAATALARLANITQMPQGEFDKLGSSIVALGNNLATTEAEIVEMSLRIAGAGKQVGLTQAEILGFSGALSSVGIEAAAGGSAISRVMLRIQKDVLGGGKSLEKLASVSGVSAKEFARQFEEAPAQAIVTFVQGLQKIESEGGNVVGALESVGFTELRTRDALLRLVGAGDLLSDSLGISTAAWQENTALATEAEQRYGTTASQFQILKNQAAEVARTLGDALLPIVSEAIEMAKPLVARVTELADAFKNLDPDTQKMIFAMVGVAAAIGPVLLVVGKLIMALGAIIKVVGVVIAAFNPVTLAVVAVAAGIAALVAGVLYLWNTSEAFRSAMIGFWEAIKTTVLNVVNQLKAKLDENRETIVKLQDAFAKIAQFIGGTVVPIVAQFYKTHLVNFIKALGDLISFLIDVVVAVVEFVEAVQRARQRAREFGEAVGKAISDAVKYVGELPDKVRTALSGAINWLFETGRNMVQGLINGAGSLLRNIGSFFLNMLPGWIVGPFKRALGIQSPSKVFFGFGENVIEGFIAGIESKKGSLSASVVDGAKKAADAAQEILKRMSDIQQSIASGMIGQLDLGAAMEAAKASGRSVVDEFVNQGARIQEFGRTMNHLLAMGLSRQAYEQIMAMGAERGTDIANALNDGNIAQNIARVNDVYNSVAATGQQVGAQAAVVWEGEGAKIALRSLLAMVREYMPAGKGRTELIKQIRGMITNIGEVGSTDMDAAGTAAGAAFTSRAGQSIATGAASGSPFATSVGQLGTTAGVEGVKSFTKAGFNVAVAFVKGLRETLTPGTEQHDAFMVAVTEMIAMITTPLREVFKLAALDFATNFISTLRDYLIPDAPGFIVLDEAMLLMLAKFNELNLPRFGDSGFKMAEKFILEFIKEISPEGTQYNALQEQASALADSLARTVTYTVQLVYAGEAPSSPSVDIGAMSNTMGYAPFWNMPGAANGGMIRAGGFSLVGERGPEIIGVGMDSTVVRSETSRGMLGGSNISITVNAGMGTDGAAVGRQVVEAIKKYERQSGKVFAAA